MLPLDDRIVAACALTLVTACGQATTNEPPAGRPPVTPTVPAPGPPVKDLSESIRAVQSAWKRGATDEHALRDIRLACDTETEWRQVVEGLGVIHMRSKWPKSDELRAWIRGCAWTQADWRVTAVPRDMGLHVISARSPVSWCGNGAMMELAENRTLHVGFPEKNEPFIDWDVTVQLGGTVPSEWSQAWSGCVRVPIQLVASVDEAIPLGRVPRLDTVVREGIAVSSHPTDTGRTYRVSLGATDQDFTTGISVRIQARRGEVLIESVLVPLRLDVEPQGGVTHMALADLTDMPANMTPSLADQEQWTLHVTGTNEGLLDSWEVERAWGGEFTMPLSEAMTRYHFAR